MKILVVTNIYPNNEKPVWGTFVKEQVESIRQMLSDDSELDVFFINGRRSKFEYLKALFILPLFIKKHKYDIVHAHYGLTLISLILVRKPIIVTYHGSDLLTSPTKYLTKLLAPKANYSIVVAQRLLSEIPNGSIIYCGINTADFALPENKSHIKLSDVIKDRRLKILFPADPNNKIKNYQLYKETCNILKRDGFNVEEIHLKNIVRKEVPKLYWDSNILLLTSFSEGSPTVIKEAIAAKLPFVAVDVGDVRQWAANIDFGIVVDSKNPKDIAKNVIKLLNNDKYRNELDNTKVVDLLDNKIISKKLFMLYKYIYNNKQRSIRFVGYKKEKRSVYNEIMDRHN